MSRSLSTLVACVAVASVLSGCGDSDGTGIGPTTSTADGLTAPGTTLALGDTATVPVGDGGTVVELSVESITEGSPDLLPDLGGTPYFVQLKATVVKGDGHDFFAERFMTGYSGDVETGAIQAPLKVGPCGRAYFEVDPPVGTTIEPCLTMIAGTTGGIDRVGFADDDIYRIPDDTSVDWS